MTPCILIWCHVEAEWSTYTSVSLDHHCSKQWLILNSKLSHHLNQYFHIGILGASINVSLIEIQSFSLKKRIWQYSLKIEGLLIQAAVWCVKFPTTVNVMAWVSNQMPSKVWDEIPYPFPKFNDCTVGCNCLSIQGFRLNRVSKRCP